MIDSAENDTLEGVALMEHLMELSNVENIKSIRNNFEKYRQEFTWGRNLNKDREVLSETRYLKLCEISDNHLKALVVYTDPVKTFYSPYINIGFKTELKYRVDNQLSVADYD